MGLIPSVSIWLGGLRAFGGTAEQSIAMQAGEEEKLLEALDKL
jgi:hypothetical protein